MKNTGMVRRIDDLGRIVVPKEMRKVLDIDAGDPVEIWVDGNAVMLKKYVKSDECQRCGTHNNTVRVDGIVICRHCASVIAKHFENQEG